MELSEEQRQLQSLLEGKVVRNIWRRKKSELVVQFSDGTDLYVDWQSDGSLEMSVSGGVK